MKTTIYVVSHKPFNKPEDSIYKKIFVGKNRPNDKTAVQDNTGDNIAEKNSSFCELTAIYWILKNDSSSDYLGISHYRRYFANRVNSPTPLTKTRAEKLLQKYDFIAPVPTYIRNGNVLSQYLGGHPKEALDKCRDEIEKSTPEFLPYFDKFLTQKTYCQYNMLLTSKQLFKEYHDWLFNILFAVEKKTDLTKYDEYNQRLYGFLSERLFNVWVMKKINDGMKVKYLDVIYTEDKIKPIRKTYRLAMSKLHRNS